MLLCVRERSGGDSHSHSSLQRQFSHGRSQKLEDGGSGNGTRVSHFLPTSRRIVQFSNGKVFYFSFLKKCMLLLIFNHIVAFTLLSARFSLHGLFILM